MEEANLDGNISIITDLKGREIVVIHNIRFKGKRKIDWNDVEDYLKKYIGKIYEIEDTQDRVYIEKDFPDEFGGSEDTARLKGTLAKAKANAAQGIPELIKIAVHKRYNVFNVEMLVRHAADNKLYLYDIVNIKKETSTPLKR